MQSFASHTLVVAIGRMVLGYGPVFILIQFIRCGSKLGSLAHAKYLKLLSPGL
jgi:hypothetical protein